MSKRKAAKDIDCPKTKLKSNDLIISQEFLKIANQLNCKLDNIDFIKNIDYVYNPTRYAYLGYKVYVEKYCSKRKKVMFLGMNPGPWGMSQTGVPFGDVNSVKNWLKIEEDVQKPKKELESRPVLGFACHRSEVSGQRFWGLMKDLCEEPTTFFNHCFVYNYLPLQFMKSTGKNLPPTALKVNDQKDLYKICDEALIDVVNLYEVHIIVAIGKFAESRAKAALENTVYKNNVKVVSILHPSPQSKAANNWRIDAARQLEDLGILEYLKSD